MRQLRARNNHEVQRDIGELAELSWNLIRSRQRCHKRCRLSHIVADPQSFFSGLFKSLNRLSDDASTRRMEKMATASSAPAAALAVLQGLLQLGFLFEIAYSFSHSIIVTRSYLPNLSLIQSDWHVVGALVWWHIWLQSRNENSHSLSS